MASSHSDSSAVDPTPAAPGGSGQSGDNPLLQVLDPLLLEVLACPAEHHAPLVLGEPGLPNAESLTCTECGRIFPVLDGIPVLLLDEARRSEEPRSPGSAL